MDETRGRPPKPEKDRRKIRFQVRLSPAELEAIERAGGDKPSTWAREVLLKAAKRKVTAERGGYDPIRVDTDPSGSL